MSSTGSPFTCPVSTPPSGTSVSATPSLSSGPLGVARAVLDPRWRGDALHRRPRVAHALEVDGEAHHLSRADAERLAPLRAADGDENLVRPLVHHDVFHRCRTDALAVHEDRR